MYLYIYSHTSVTIIYILWYLKQRIVAGYNIQALYTNIASMVRPIVVALYLRHIIPADFIDYTWFFSKQYWICIEPTWKAWSPLRLM